MPSPAVHRRRYAFETSTRWIRGAEAALKSYAATDDTSALDDLVGAWDEAVDLERIAARVAPSADEWAELDRMLASAAMPRLTARREVYRAPWEKIGRSVRRRARLEALRAPRIILENEQEIVEQAIASLDVVDRRCGEALDLDAIPSASGEVLDLSQLGMRVAELAAGPFPRDVGDGEAVDEELSPTLRERMQALVEIDEFWAIHDQRRWESGPHACAVVGDEELWAPASMRGARLLELPRDAASWTCAAWRRVMPALPVGDRGGPMFVEERGEVSVVSFVLVVTPEAPPFAGLE